MAEQVMMESPQMASDIRRSPLAHLAARLEEGSAAGPYGVRLREVPFLTMAGLRLDPESAYAGALVEAAGVPLPGGCGETTGTADGTAILWQGPQEFLLLAPDGSDAVGKLKAALGDAPGAVVDLSANRTTLELTGPSARFVLEKGCPLDLHPRVFRPGGAVSTVLGRVPVLLWQVDETTYRILPRASFADYTARWLLDAMTEFSAPGAQQWP